MVVRVPCSSLALGSDLKGHERHGPDPKAALRRIGVRRAQIRVRDGGDLRAAATARLLQADRPGARAHHRGLHADPDRDRPAARHGGPARAGARICVPVIAGAGQPLDFREWTPDCTLVEGPFKAMVPEPATG
jgi:5-formyltetrahydrofolate cyclo-ligase